MSDTHNRIASKIIYRIFILTTLTLSVTFSIILFLFHLITGNFFVRPDLSDYVFHISRIQTPLCFLNEFLNDGLCCYYYPPLFHISVNLLAHICGLIPALSLIISFLIFFLLPLSVYRLSFAYWENPHYAAFSGFIFIIGSTTSIMFIISGIYPQALSLFCFIMGITPIIADLKHPARKIPYTPFLWLIPSLLSHSKGVIIYLIALIIWIILRKSYLFMIFLPLTLLLIVNISPQFYIPHAKQTMEILFLWLNPLTLLLAYRGLPQVKDKTTIYLLLLMLIILTLAGVDKMYRPILFIPAILSVFAGKEIINNKYGLHSLVIVLTVWALVFLFSFIGIYGLYLKQGIY